MMVVSLDPLTKKINLFSILRDTYVNIDGYGKERINTAITHGPNAAMQAAGDLLGIPVQYYVYTDFQGFIKLVDAVGGVDFDVEKDMHYTSKADNNEYDIDLKKDISIWMARQRSCTFVSVMMRCRISLGPNVSVNC